MKRLLLFSLFLLAFLERTYLDLGPNTELVTAALILSALYVGKKQSFWLVFVIIAATDLVIGNSNIFIFTWTGFLLPALFVSKFFTQNQNVIKKVFSGTLAGMSSTAFFFLWTNFGVWLLSGMYTKNLLGLLMSYTMGLPFLRYQAISTLLFVPLGILLTEAALSIIKKFQPENYIRTGLSQQSVNAE
jgi:hypothetical protein